ncbi:MAG: S8 family serine peptidase [Bacteroidota bacterium]
MTRFSVALMVTLDFGLGMLVSALYLAFHNERARLFWVPGILSLIVAGGFYSFSAITDYVCEEFGDKKAQIELLVELGPDDDISEIKDILNRYGAKAHRAFPNVDLSENEDLAQYYVVRVDSIHKDMLSMQLRKDRENVDQLEVNNPVSLFEPIATERNLKKDIKFIANDPFLNKQWFADKLDYNGVYDLLKGKKPKKKAKVAIVDTGVDKDHEDLKGIYQKSGTDGDYDLHSHGTHCAGLAGAATNNGVGIGSMNFDGTYITITGYPALDDYGRGDNRRVAKAIIDAAEGGADVISMSLGGYSPIPPKVQVDAVKYANKLGAIVVVAAGNSNANAKRYSPANIKGVITVAAVDENLNKAVFSNTNQDLKMPIAAPGVNCLSSVPESKYQEYSGTSMATPVVAGLLGMMKAFNPDLTTQDAYNIMKKSGLGVRDSKKIGKLIQPKAALKEVLK